MSEDNQQSDENKGNQIHNPHDKLLFGTLRNHDMVKEAILNYMPQELVNQLTLNQLKPYKTKLLSPQMKEFQADVMYEVPFQNTTALLLFHCEHQSKPERTLPLKVWQYIFLVLMEYAENYPDKPLPVPFVLIIYTGEDKYTQSTQLFDLFGENKSLAQKYFLQGIPLVDVCRMKDEDIKKHTLFGLTEYIFKHKKAKNFQAILETILPWLNEIELKIGSNYATIYIRYIIEALHQGDSSLFNEMVKQYLSKELSEKAMTIEQQLRQQGRAEGRAEGRVEGRTEGRVEGKEETAIDFLKAGASEEMVSRATGFSREQVKKLQREIQKN